MESSQLPLLHKYVLSPQDDLQLQMTKLRYRLCVREVHDVLARKSCPAEFAHLRESSDSDESDAGQEADDESEDSDHYDDDLESPIMADTAFEVNAAPDIGGDGPQCMSSPIEDKDGNYPTMKSDDSGIIMDMSSYSINESLSEPASPAAGSPNTEVIMNGHAEEHTDTPGGHSDTMITDLVNAMDGGSSPVPQITIDTVPDNKHSDDNEESTLQESTETTESTDQSQVEEMSEETHAVQQEEKTPEQTVDAESTPEVETVEELQEQQDEIAVAESKAEVEQAPEEADEQVESGEAICVEAAAEAPKPQPEIEEPAMVEEEVNMVEDEVPESLEVEVSQPEQIIIAESPSPNEANTDVITPEQEESVQSEPSKTEDITAPVDDTLEHFTEQKETIEQEQTEDTLEQTDRVAQEQSSEIEENTESLTENKTEEVSENVVENSNTEIVEAELHREDVKDESTKDKQEVSAEVEEDEMSESEEESESDEEDRVEFKRGIRCSDVNHALEILKTKYKLTPAVPKPKGKPRKPDRKSPTYHTLPRAKTRDASTLPAKRVSQPCRSSIITWSCWNISDIVHPLNNRASWLPVAPADTKPAEDGTDHDENANMRNMNKNIDSKAEEIEKLLKQRTAEEEEQKKKEQQERLKEEPAVVQEDKVEPIVEAPIEASKAPEAQAEPPKKKKKGNLWQRMVRAMRKRLGGNNRNRQQNAAKA